MDGKQTPICCKFQWRFVSSSNLLVYSKQPAYSLRLQDVQSLHTAVVEQYIEWVEHAPNGWFKDTFFADSRPMFITCLFGQDQPICLANEHNMERNIWKSERDYTKMKYVSVALATNIRFVLYYILRIQEY